MSWRHLHGCTYQLSLKQPLRQRSVRDCIHFSARCCGHRLFPRTFGLVFSLQIPALAVTCATEATPLVDWHRSLTGLFHRVRHGFALFILKYQERRVLQTVLHSRVTEDTPLVDWQL